MFKLLFSLGLILSGLTLGYIFQQLDRRGTLRFPFPVEEIRKCLQKIGLFFFMSISFMGAVWVIRIEDMRIVALPILCVFALLLGGALAIFAARLMRLSRRQTGAYYACGSFTNIGSVGALVVFVFLGEEAFALVPLYKLFEELTYYAIGFPITKFYSTDRTEKERLSSRIKKVFTDPFVLIALTAVIVGGLLNLTGVKRPPFFATVTSLFVPVGTFILLVSIGMAMRISSIRKYIAQGVVIAGIKFVIIPAVIVGLAYLLGFAGMEGGLPLRVIVILSSMPVAFTALVPPSLYDLDIDLANACWLSTTIGLLAVLPWLYFLVSFI